MKKLNGGVTFEREKKCARDKVKKLIMRIFKNKIEIVSS